MGKKAKNKGHWKSGGIIQQMPTNVLSDSLKWSEPKHTVPAGWLCPMCYVQNYDGCWLVYQQKLSLPLILRHIGHGFCNDVFSMKTCSQTDLHIEIK